ncbi:MAG TPA: hypothetical protein VFQ36_02000 [Ktedonobacteraceae bacterium]|nr:hypothetical protein [Ktedonobacteraceae bacterium]
MTEKTYLGYRLLFGLDPSRFSLEDDEISLKKASIFGVINEQRGQDTTPTVS